jgi:hypothetical protein
MPVGDGWTATKSTSELTVTRPLKSAKNNEVFKLIVFKLFCHAHSHREYSIIGHILQCLAKMLFILEVLSYCIQNDF